jgi:S-layer protein (TIGR01567 family)
MNKNLILILLLTLSALSDAAWSKDTTDDIDPFENVIYNAPLPFVLSENYDKTFGEGWYIQELVVKKDEEIDLPPCYTDREVSVTNGYGEGSVMLSQECFKEGGTQLSNVGWTKPPAKMKPNSNVSFNMTFNSPSGTKVSGLIGSTLSGTILEADSTYPKGTNKGIFTVPNGSIGAEFVLYVSFVMASGLHGFADYKYKYLGSAEDNIGKSGNIEIDGRDADPRSAKTFDPKSLKPRTEIYLSNFDGNVHIVRNGERISAKKGFQLRVGDIIETSDGFAWINRDKDGFKGLLKPNSELNIEEADLKLLNELGAMYIGFYQELATILSPGGAKSTQRDTEVREKRLEMKYATAHVTHTIYVGEQISDASIIKVLNGTVEFISNVTGEKILVNAGEMVTATATGLSPLESFDVKAEKAIWDPYLSTTKAVESKESSVIYDSWNTGSVNSNPTCSPFFTITEPQMITYIDTYHWNNAADAPGGTIGLRNGYGTQYGPWVVETSLDQGEVPKGYWIAHPNEVIPAGTYTIEDSNPATWSQNSESPCGFSKVEGYAVTMNASGKTDSLAPGIRESVPSTTSTKDISDQPAENEKTDAKIEGERATISTADEVEKKAGVGIAGDEGTVPHSIVETISSAIKKSSTPAKKEPATIEKSTDSIVSDKPFKIHSQVATGDFEWNPQNFAGFYYDLNRDLGTEVLTATLKDGKLSGSYPYGLTYQTTAQINDFAFEDWGFYNVIGFMGEKYFAGYLDTAGSTDDRLFEASGSKNVISKNDLIKLLIDDDTETTVTTGTPLTLQDGYKLSIDSVDIDGNQVTLTLSKDGSKLATRKISPSRDSATITDKTFIYKKNFGNSNDVVVVAVHFKNAFRGADQNLATIDAVWQLSDEYLDVSEGTKYDKMTVQTVTTDSITMNNEDNDITLSRNKDISLMPGIGITTADDDSLRYCVYKEITKPGTYELRGTAATDTFTWTADNFAGFYYDIDDNLETESLRATVTDGKLAQPDGTTYTTGTVTNSFKFEDWGSYRFIGFLGEKCFAEYVGAFLFDKSTDKSALAKKQLLKILADDDTEKTVTTDTPLKLEEGYELAIKSISAEGNNVYLELSKDGVVVDSAIIHPSQDAATMADKTYFYKKDVGDLKKMVIIAVHFKNAFEGADQNLATVDGVWQLSFSPISVTEGTSFGKLVISEITGDHISMNNKDNSITLSKNEYVSLAGDIYLKTADSDSLRYYIVKEITREVQGANQDFGVIASGTQTTESHIGSGNGAGGETGIDAKTWYNKGSALYDQGKYDEAIEAFDESIRIDPEYKWAWHDKGFALYKLGRHNEAIRAFDEAIKRKPESWAPWLMKSLSFDALGNSKEADAALSKAKEMGYTE